MLVGVNNFAPYGKLKYEVGYLFGLTEATPAARCAGASNTRSRFKLTHSLGVEGLRTAIFPAARRRSEPPFATDQRASAKHLADRNS